MYTTLWLACCRKLPFTHRDTPCRSLQRSWQLSVVHCLQGAQGSQAQVIVSTISGASSQEVQNISNTLQQSVNSGQFANSLRQSGAQTPTSLLHKPLACKQPLFWR